MSAEDFWTGLLIGYALGLFVAYGVSWLEDLTK